MAGRWWVNAWRNLIRSRRTEQDLQAEIEAHVELLTDEKVGQGVPPVEARRRALAELGGTESLKEEVRDVRAGSWIDTFLRDVRYGARVMRRRPGFTLAALLALALGIGATTAVFSVVNGVLLRPLPYGGPDRLVVVLHGGIRPVAPANFLDWREQVGAFSDMAAAELWRTDLSTQDEPEKLWALRVTPNMFSVLDVQPALGRLLGPDTDVVGNDREVVLSHHLWQRRFDADPAIVGRSITLDATAHTIVGVMPAEFMFAPFWATDAELWAPLALGDRATSRSGQSLRVFARLAPGVTLDQAQSEVAAVTERLEARFQGTNRDIVVVPLMDRVVGDVRPALFLLLGAVGFVLLLTSANVAHMLLAHGAARRMELGLRLALGASKLRIVRQVLTESLALVFVGGALGFVLAIWGVALLRALGPADLPRLETVTLDLPVALFALGVSLVTGLLFGLAPAIQAGRASLVTTLATGARGSSLGAGRDRMRGLLVASEMALALVLLVGAVLTIRSFGVVQRIEPGFEPARVLSMTISVTGSASGVAGRRGAFFQEVVERVRALPGVENAAAINHLPLAGDRWGFGFRLDGRPRPEAGDWPGATYRVVLPGYFDTMGITMLSGRDVTDADTFDSQPVAVVNALLADRHWPGESAVGKRLAFGSAEPPTWVTVVGVVENTMREEWSGEADEEVYVPYLQQPDYLASPASHFSYLTLVARASGEPEALVPAVRRAIWELDAGVPISDVQTMASVVAEATARPRFYMVLLTIFGLSALSLAAVGVYGAMSYAVARRRHEIGIRLALGETPAGVIRLVVGQGMRLALVGTAVGLVGAVLLAGSMRTIAVGVEPGDPITLAVGAVTLCAVAFAACVVPARRAASVDALTALRTD